MKTPAASFICAALRALGFFTVVSGFTLGLPNGLVANPPVVDAHRRIVVGYDSGNGVLVAFDIADDGSTTTRWRREQNHACHPLLFPDTGELVTNDNDQTRMADAIVVLDIETGAERMRVDLGRIIVDRFRDAQSRVSAIVLDPRVEQELRRSLHEKNLVLEPLRLEKLIVALANAWRKAHVTGKEVALLTDGMLRRPLRAALVRSLADLSIISYQEIPTDVGLLPNALIRPEDLNA